MSPRDLHYAERPTAAAGTGRCPTTHQRPSSPATRHAERAAFGHRTAACPTFAAAIGSPPLAVVLWNGEEISAESSQSRSEGDSPIFHKTELGWQLHCHPGGGSATATPTGWPVARILFRDRAAFWKVLLDPGEEVESASEDYAKVGSFVVAHTGARRNYAVPAILASAGMLSKFYTDICGNVGLGKAARLGTSFSRRLDRLARRERTRGGCSSYSDLSNPKRATSHERAHNG